jgi:hypothetical protein
LDDKQAYLESAYSQAALYGEAVEGVGVILAKSGAGLLLVGLITIIVGKYLKGASQK